MDCLHEKTDIIDYSSSGEDEYSKEYCAHCGIDIDSFNRKKRISIKDTKEFSDFITKDLRERESRKPKYAIAEAVEFYKLKKIEQGELLDSVLYHLQFERCENGCIHDEVAWLI